MRTAEQALVQDHSLYEVLYVAQEDLAQATYFASHLLKKGWHFEPWERRWTTYMQQSAYTTALVVAYSRPFTDSRGWPKFPQRLIPYDQQQKVLHKKILNLRNEVYAHSDVAARNVRPYKIDGYPSAIVSAPRMRFTKEETELLLRMIGAIRSSIENRLGKLIDSVKNET